jgi:hypothetical protein
MGERGCSDRRGEEERASTIAGTMIFQRPLRGSRGG